MDTFAYAEAFTQRRPRWSVREDTHYYAQFSDGIDTFPPDDAVLRRATWMQAHVDVLALKSIPERQVAMEFLANQKAAIPATLERTTSAEQMASYFLCSTADEVLALQPAFTRLLPPGPEVDIPHWDQVFHHLGVTLPLQRCAPAANEDFFA